MFMQLFFFLKFTQRVTSQMVSNQEETLKRLISMLPIAQKLYVVAKNDLCEMYKLSMSNFGGHRVFVSHSARTLPVF